MANIAWIGLGVMGFPLAGHLAKAGHSVTVYNRTTAKAETWVAANPGHRFAKTPAEAADGAEFVFTCVGGDDDLRGVTSAPDGAFQTLGHGGILVDHSTTSATVARELEAVAAERRIAFIDAPVSGGEAGARSGALSIMAGGSAEAFERASAVMASYAKAARLIGPSGSGQLTKMVNQICIAGLLQGLSEGIAFAERAGLDIEAVMATISKGAAQSWQMENRWRTMSAREFDFGFAVDWMRKDLGIAIAEARRNGAELPVTSLVDGYYGDLQQRGGRRWDTSSLIARLDPV